MCDDLSFDATSLDVHNVEWRIDDIFRNCEYAGMHVEVDSSARIIRQSMLIKRVAG